MTGCRSCGAAAAAHIRSAKSGVTCREVWRSVKLCCDGLGPNAKVRLVFLWCDVLLTN